MTETKPKRVWFRFSIRDLLWLTAVVALAVGWWLDHSSMVHQAATKPPPGFPTPSLGSHAIERAMRPDVLNPQIPRMPNSLNDSPEVKFH
jgi:hypothetical protein